MSEIELARAIAADIDRLAYLVDPYGYFSAIGTSPADFENNVQEIAQDIIGGNCGPYIDWLQEIITDDENDTRDRARAADRLARLLNFSADRGA